MLCILVSGTDISDGTCCLSFAVTVLYRVIIQRSEVCCFTIMENLISLNSAQPILDHFFSSPLRSPCGLRHDQRITGMSPTRPQVTGNVMLTRTQYSYLDSFDLERNANWWGIIAYYICIVLITLSQTGFSAESQGSTKGCHGFLETKMFNGWRVVLVVLKMYVWRHSTVIIPSLTTLNQLQLLSRTFLIL